MKIKQKVKMPWRSYTAWQKYWNQLKGPMQREYAWNLYQTSEQYLYIFDAWIRIRIICELFHDDVFI
jgi:hypothetical protein